MVEPVPRDFPDSEWHSAWLALADAPTPNMPANWRSAVWLPPPPVLRLKQECQYLLAIKAEREDRAKAITAQARGDVYQIVETVQEVVGELEEEQAATRAVCHLLYNNLDPVLFYFKRMFRRGRPFMSCPDIEPMFPKGDPDYPAHAAYPSGHSSQAHALAYFYARLFPSLTDLLMEAADEIARNREVAGLHYPSDTLAGKLLAGQVVDLLFTSPTFKVAADAARAEWP